MVRDNNVNENEKGEETSNDIDIVEAMELAFEDEFRV